MDGPNIYVERCSECPAHRGRDWKFWCGILKRWRTYAMDRRFPRWCPLLKQSITIRRTVSLGSIQSRKK